MKYEDFHCPRCRKDTLHRVKNKYGVASDGKSFLKYQAKHCLVCNKYWGYSRDRKKAQKHVSFKKR